MEIPDKLINIIKNSHNMLRITIYDFNRVIEVSSTLETRDNVFDNSIRQFNRITHAASNLADINNTIQDQLNSIIQTYLERSSH